MESLLQGLDGVICFLDDILITGTSRQQHIITLKKVLEILQGAGLKVNKNKCLFFQDKVNYLGHIIDQHGLHTCPDKVNAIVNAPSPSSVTQLKAILGIINYYGRFIKGLSACLQPLYNLLKKDVKWEWSQACEKAFLKIKSIMSTTPILVHYDPKKELRLTCDASDYGLGVMLTHIMPDKSEKPISFASRTLNDTERKYSQIEKEGLAIIYALSKYNQYLYGRNFTLVTDHKPLVNIFHPKKGIPLYSANRLRRWAVILSNYQYEIEYVKSHENKADFLSRLPLKSDSLLPNDFKDINSFNFVNYCNNRDINIDHKLIQKETSNDTLLTQVINFMKKGWPKFKKLNKDITPFYNYRTGLSIENDCLLWNNRLCIPFKLRGKILESLHRSHLGMVKMKSLARSYFWWPKMNEQIEAIVSSCESCKFYRTNPPKSNVNLWKWPKQQWSRLHIDYLGPIKGKFYFIILDAYSKWIEVLPTNTITSEFTIKALRHTFARFGLPKIIVSDNGTQLVSGQMKHFLNLNGIKHITTAPFHPQSNGAAENAVKQVKNAIKKGFMSDKW